MAKEGVEKAEETEQMIEKETSKEPAEGGDGSHRLGDAQEMRAVVLAGFGGLNKLKLSRKAMPEPQDGELKIRVKAWSSIHDFLVFLSFARWALREWVGESLGWRCCPGTQYPQAAGALSTSTLSSLSSPTPSPSLWSLRRISEVALSRTSDVG
ncbi:hypothetical protein NN561_006914 [Cricetulus griseus]